jgi:hypothetical protein
MLYGLLLTVLVLCVVVDPDMDADPDQHPEIAEPDPITDPTFHLRISQIFANTL